MNITIQDNNHTAQVISRIKGLRGIALEIGVFEEDSVRSSGDVTNAQLVRMHEDGTPRMPARPFFSEGLQESREEWIGHLKEAGQAMLDGNKRVAQNRVRNAGQAAVRGIQNKMLEGPWEPLSPKYINRSRWWNGGRLPGRRVGTPLLDTGQLFNSISFKIRKRD